MPRCLSSTLLVLFVCYIVLSCEAKGHRRRQSLSRNSKKDGEVCDKFQCADGTCIERKYVCDGWKDCDSDELTCTDYQCRGLDFSKLTGFNCNPLLNDDNSNEEECIPYYMFCDGKEQCKNGNDELYCDYFGENELYDILTN
ncbi:uncharacterized protein [Antedon mediterranea]|uniref:uncharacterized protein n=1 Tax=Antedon mediterranea TaxID=105859 RepID=UPI003AF56F8F